MDFMAFPEGGVLGRTVQTMTPQATTDALRVLCPTCGAPVGKPCHPPGEASVRDPHKDRLALAAWDGETDPAALGA